MMNTDETVIHTPEETERRANAHGLNPGSSKAVSYGCKCAVLDNCPGFGIPDDNGGRNFYYWEDCPLHTAEYAAVAARFEAAGEVTE